ncbi:MAG: hypothetical protein KAT68_03075 [Bacteroidales bacterium]|nr:hypothetical protein [Bacteroidales bacterium]
MKKSLIVICIFLIISCNYRTPSRIRFSKICDIKIPKDIKVIRDEYQDMWQDFAIIYEIKLSPKNCNELTRSIRESKYYNSETFVYDNIHKDMYIEVNGMRAVWARTQTGYVFLNDWNRDVYSVEIDTINLIAKFNESHD